MGKVIATYITRITLREPDDVAEGQIVAGPPPLDRLDEAIAMLLRTSPPRDGANRIPDVHVSSERVDR